MRRWPCWSRVPRFAQPQLAAFLVYVVNTALAGRQGEIKGYTIAAKG
ncbi:MAG: hypothetical protein ACOVN4_11055 [Bosea sp. (in: a-proteobacteria)]